VGSLLLSGALVALDTSDEFRSDQQAYNLLVERKLDPSLLARDPIFGREPDLFHVPWFLDLQAWLARRAGGDPERALAWLAWLMGALYLAGHYALFRAVSGRPLPAALAAIGALAVRNSLGGEFWGFDGLRSAATRTIMAGLTPLLLLLFLRWRERGRFPAFFLLPGMLFNVHPVSAYQLAQATGLAHVWLAPRRLRAAGQVAIGAGLFVLGALPYVARFFPLRDNVSEAADLALARAALDYRFPYLLYPIALPALLSVAFHASLLVCVWLWWRRRGRPSPAMSALEPVLVAAVALGLLGPALFQALGRWLDRPYVDIQQLRSVRLAYPILLCALALTYARLLDRGTRGARAAVALLLLASLVSPAWLIHAASEERREAVKARLGLGPAARAPTATQADPGAPADPGAVEELWRWARRETPSGALFLSDDFHFRLEAHRAITGSYKDGSFAFLAGSRPLVAWYRLMRETEACRAAGSRACWFALGRRLGVDYVVVDPRLPAAANPPPDFTETWTRGGWSVWKRAGSAG